jgi:hypothetical protein
LTEIKQQEFLFDRLMLRLSLWSCQILLVINPVTICW